MELRVLDRINNYGRYVKEQNARSGIKKDNTNYKMFSEDLNGILSITGEKKLTILDIGCRTGNLVHDLFSKHGHNAYGIDIGTNAENNFWTRFPEETRKRLKLHDIHDGVPFEKQYDIIILSHVLEHCYDPNLVLNLCLEALNENGVLYVKLPIEKFHGKDQGSHYAFFKDKGAMEDYFNSVGLKILKSRQHKSLPEALLIISK